VNIIVLPNVFVSSLVVHIVSILQFNDFCQRYDPWMIFFKFVLTTPLIPLMQFQGNFTGLIVSSSSYANYTSFPVKWFFAELWPLYKNGVFACYWLLCSRFTNADACYKVATTPGDHVFVVCMSVNHKTCLHFFSKTIGVISSKLMI
jgi:hypothetical protein